MDKSTYGVLTHRYQHRWMLFEWILEFVCRFVNS